MNTTRCVRRLQAALPLAAAVLLGACAQTPTQPDFEAATTEPPVSTTAPGLSGSSGPGPGPVRPITPSVPVPTLEQAPVVVRPDHPQTYTVAPSDTLWSIAGRFLQNPWQWRQIWRQNPQVRNPHRIYPGDVLRFSYDANGNPQLELSQGGEVPLIKLSPEIRVDTISQPILPVPRAAIESFLTRALVLSEAEWKALPYLIADEDQKVVYVDRDRVYGRGATFDQPRYQVYQPGEPLREPGSGRSLGIAGVYQGEARLEKDGDPATFILSRTVMPIRAGARLVEMEHEEELFNFEPHPVPPDTEGFILSSLDRDTLQITQYASVVINLGHQEGLEPGHVLAIHNQDRQVVDPVSGQTVMVPGERAGLAMVYKVHDLVSYAIVMEATRFIRSQDRVSTP